MLPFRVIQLEQHRALQQGVATPYLAGSSRPTELLPEIKPCLTGASTAFREFQKTAKMTADFPPLFRTNYQREKPRNSLAPMSPEREQLGADVLIIGAGPAGLACALRLANLIEQHTQANKSPALSAENIYVLEKAREVGAHQLSGAIMDARALRELVPDFEKTAPLDTPVTGDAVYYFSEKSSWKLPITPPPFKNHGNYVVSLNRIVKWLGGLVEKKGVNLFTQFAGRNLLYEKEGGKSGIAGVLTEDKGVDKNGKPKDNYTPGYELARESYRPRRRPARLAH